MARLRRDALRPAAVLALLAVAGCAGTGRSPVAETGPVPPGAGFTADTATREGLASGATASEAACRVLPDGVWADGGGRRECLRYAAAGVARGAAFARTALVLIPGDAAGSSYRFAGGRPQVEGAGEAYEVSAEARRADAAALSAAAGGLPVIVLGRPGMHGSSGHHARDRHTRAEVDLVDAALTALRRRYGFRDVVLSGFSSGGALAANLLARRDDISCAVLASAPLDLATFYRGPDGALPDHYAMRGDLADPMRTVGTIRPGAAILVLGDRRDRKVPAAAWEAWAAAARRAGLDVANAEVSGADGAEPAGAASFHQTAARGTTAALACAKRAPAVGPPPVRTP